MRRIGWLHVSDFHFRAAGDPLSQTVAANALIDDVGVRIQERTPPSFVVVSGDIAFSGLKPEYDAAQPFLERMATAAQVTPDRCYFVPGNHDVDRSKNRFGYVGACTELTSEVEVDRAIVTGDAMPLLERQRDFWDFVDAFTSGQVRTPVAGGLGYVAEIPVGRHVVALVGLNSAWLSGRSGEEMRLLIGERQVIEGLGLVDGFDPLFQIAVAHHPIEWMHEWDQGVCRTRLFRACDIFQRGHLHQSEVAIAGGPDAPCLTIAAGSGHATRFYGNSYNWIELDMGTGVCSVYSYRYDPNLGAYEATHVLTGRVRLRGSMPGSAQDMASALAKVVPEAAAHAGYMAALLLGSKEEVPIKVGESIEFVIPSVAREIEGNAMEPVEEFLGLRNLLRLYQETVPLESRIAEHRVAILGLVEYLEALGPLGQAASDRLGSQVLQAGPATRSTELRHTAAFIEELQRQGEWHVLEIQAQALLKSPDVHVARTAKRLFVEALMHSDEAGKRQSAAQIGAELLGDQGATLDDYLLAAASAEVVNDDSRAIEYTIAALSRYPRRDALLTYARGLATRTGSATLRAKIDDHRRSA